MLFSENMNNYKEKVIYNNSILFFEYFDKIQLLNILKNTEENVNVIDCNKINGFVLQNDVCMKTSDNSIFTNGKVIEYDYLEGVSPIMDDENEIYKEMRVKSPHEFENILQLHDYVRKLSDDILNGKREGFCIEMEKYKT